MVSISRRDGWFTKDLPVEPEGLSSSTNGWKVSIDLVTPATAGSLLVLSENYYPGWTATPGSSPLRVSRVNYNLIGVELPAGAQHIEASFYDSYYGTGRTVTLTALSVAAVLIVAGVVADRRRSEPDAVGV